jgi:ferredoxin
MEDGAPKIIPHLCKGCGKCKSACPKGVIELLPQDAPVFVKCLTPLKGKQVKSVCEVGCIKCKACQKVCKEQALSVDEKVQIDYKKCKACRECIEKCPTGALSTIELTLQ